MSSNNFRAAIVTVSDRVSQNLAEDRSGPALAEQLTNAGWALAERIVIPDETNAIQQTVRKLADTGAAHLIVTTGGTGFAPRDVTPDAITPLLEKEAPGLAIAMITASLQKTPMAALSRPVCGVRARSVIITLPGSTKGSTENLDAVLSVLPHAVELAKGDTAAGDRTHQSMGSSQPEVSKAATAAGSGHKHHRCHHHHSHTRHNHKDESASSHDVTVPVALRARTSQYPLISYEDALRTVLSHAKALPPIQLFITDPGLVGSVLAEDVVAKENVPGYRASVVDGYAIIASDGPGTYPVQTSSTADADQPSISLKPGHIARITTGAPVPPGANAVVMVEDTTVESSSEDSTIEKTVTIHCAASDGDHIREIGSDISLGTTILQQGDLITPAEIGLLASVGVTSVSVIRKPVVGVMSTGNELVAADSTGPLAYGAIRNSNGPMLQTAVAEKGFEAIALGVARDSAQTLADAIKQGLERCDVLVTTGGVSMGEMDLLKPVLQKSIGATIHFGRVMLKPGKPTTFATVSISPTGPPKLIFALPGNPVSALVTFNLFTLPALRSLRGFQHPHHPIVKAALADPLPLSPRPEFHRAHVSLTTAESGMAQFIAYSTGSQRSSRLMSMKGANALLRLPSGDGELPKGSIVEGLLVGDLA